MALLYEIEAALKRGEIQRVDCEDCGGLGYKDDADFGDISFNKWECPTCKGLKFKPITTDIIEITDPDIQAKYGKILNEAFAKDKEKK